MSLPRTWAAVGLAAMGLALLGLAGCDNGPSAVQRQQAAGSQMAAPLTGDGARRGDFGGREEGGRDERGRDSQAGPARLLDGKTIWASSRRYSAEENARRAFERNGAAFGARDMEDFARKARAFGEHPPRGVETLERANGDRLLYDPKGNVFAVISKDGAPRTMFKPDDGAAYWQEQKSREANRQNSARSRSRDREA